MAAIVRDDASQAVDSDDEQAPGGARRDAAPLLHS
jgi:hypothetical protein